jgi:uncharacterized protein (TIGR04255 family)
MASSYETAPVTFRSPPVIEVALAVQFQPGVLDTTRILGQFWPLISGEYPRLEPQPAFPPQTEEFGRPSPVQIEMLAGPPAPRFWFLSEAGERLVQVQSDRVIFNWRKTDDADQYPRYRELRPEFERHFTELLGLLTADEQAEVRPTWCEVTYVNHILGETDTQPPSLGEVLTVVEDPAASASLPELEDAQLLQRFRLTDEAGTEPVGRLHVTAAPAVRNIDQRPLLSLSLVARLRAIEATPEGALASLDRGRDVIVRGFRDLTMPSMHERWGIE